MNENVAAPLKRSQPNVYIENPKRQKACTISWSERQARVEQGMESNCLCSLSLSELVLHLDPLLAYEGADERLLLVNLLGWLGESLHEDMLEGVVCSTVQRLVNHLIRTSQFFALLLDIVNKDPDVYMKHSASEALSALLPLSLCGQDISIQSTEISLKAVIRELKFTTPLVQPPATADSHSAGHIRFVTDDFSPASLTADMEGTAAGLGDAFNLEDSSGARSSFSSSSFPGSSGSYSMSVNGLSNSSSCLQSSDSFLSSEDLQQQAWLLRILYNFVSHGGRQRDESAAHRNRNPECQTIQLEDEMLCQDVQIKCLVTKSLDPVWQELTKSLADILAKSVNAGPKGNLSTVGGSELPWIACLTEGFKLWKALISIRANLNFVASRSFAAHLSLPLYAIQDSTPPCVWRSLLDTVSECLCYGSTLGLQSIPPEEPCQLAHTLIRLVRFEGFLSRVPFNRCSGFGGSAVKEQEEGDYDKGLVQKMVIIILKSVALTTREARVDSSSGESDSSLSSRESGSSCSSDLVIIERNMSGMYKQLDSWIKSILPVLPNSKLQDNLLHILQEQDDVLVEGLLCLLDTHIALHSPGRDSQDLLDTSPTEAFVKFLSIVGGDSSVLLDFLVSNETCFLLYLLRYLKYIVKDWTVFVTSCGSFYQSTLEVIIQLKTSISRLLNKELFPYNIAPVYKLLERVQFLSKAVNPDIGESST